MMACMERCVVRPGAFSERHSADITYCLFSAVALLFLSASVSLSHTRYAYDLPSVLVLDALENKLQMYKKPQQHFKVYHWHWAPLNPRHELARK